MPTTKGDSLNGQLTSIVRHLASCGVTLEQARKEFERQFIVASLECHEGNYGRSAEALGIHRNTLRNKVDNLGIAAQEYSKRRRRRN